MAIFRVVPRSYGILTGRILPGLKGESTGAIPGIFSCNFGNITEAGRPSMGRVEYAPLGPIYPRPTSPCDRSTFATRDSRQLSGSKSPVLSESSNCSYTNARVSRPGGINLAEGSVCPTFFRTSLRWVRPSTFTSSGTTFCQRTSHTSRRLVTSPTTSLVWGTLSSPTC